MTLINPEVKNIFLKSPYNITKTQTEYHITQNQAILTKYRKNRVLPILSQKSREKNLWLFRSIEFLIGFWADKSHRPQFSENLS